MHALSRVPAPFRITGHSIAESWVQIPGSWSWSTKHEEAAASPAPAFQVCEKHEGILKKLKNGTSTFDGVLEELNKFVDRAKGLAAQLIENTSEEADRLADRERERCVDPLCCRAP